jgi:hypothetical protein
MQRSQVSGEQEDRVLWWGHGMLLPGVWTKSQHRQEPYILALLWHRCDVWNTCVQAPRDKANQYPEEVPALYRFRSAQP